MLSLEEIRQRLQDRVIRKVADACGLCETTIFEIRDGKNTNPKLSTINALSDYFEAQNDRFS